MTEVSGQHRETFAAHLQSLRADPGGPARAAVARDLAGAFADGQLSDAQRTLACRIFEALARDVDASVRRILSRQLCSSPMLPPELARRLAADIDAVACPVLQASQVLGDDDLLAVMASAGPAKLRAISGREQVSARIAQALVERGDEAVVAALLSNPGAQVAQPSLEHALLRYPDSPRVHAGLVERPRLPPSLVVRLIDRISDELVDRLITRHHLPAASARELGDLSADASYVDMMAEDEAAGNTAALADSLHARGKLTPLLLLRALMTRRGVFFFHAMARLSERSPGELSRRLPAQSPGERRLVYRAAGLPETLFPAFNAVLGVLADSRRAHGYHDQESFERAAVTQLVRIYPGLAAGDIDSVLARLQQLVPTARVDSAGTRTAGRA